jgi:crotonobetainyl-CoA:carnitine CoA-transferase CaiB-like acyl-CoA transferase
MTTPDGALAGLRVLDFTHHIAGPYCTKLLADYGADVIKVEPTTGDGARRTGPFPNDVPHPEKSGLFLHLNTNKRSIAVDLKNAGAADIIERLAQWAEVVVENFRPGVADRLGIGYDILTEINPGLIYTSISNFGQTGPYRDYRGSEIVFYGMGGEMHSTGLAEREPLKLGGNVGLYQAGAVAAVATMGAGLAGSFLDVLADTDDQPPGQHIDVSILETQLGSVDRRQSALLAHQYTGELSHRPASGGSGGFPNAVYPCADGYFQINGSRMYFPRAVAMLGNPPELATERWKDPSSQGDAEMQEEFEAGYFLPWILERTRAEVWQSAQENRVLSGPINTMADLDVDPSFNARGVFAEGDHPAAGPMRYPGRPFIMSGSPWRLRRTAPLLGEHTAEVLGEIGYTDADIGGLSAAGVILVNARGQ